MGVSVSTRVSRLGNYYAGAWHASSASEFLPVSDPASEDVLAEVPMSSESESAAVIEAAAAAFPEWRRTPPEDRIQYLFKLKDLLERNLEDLARGIDEMMIRQPLGVVAAITPFNFPAMIPLWFLPYAIACGNTFILKPSEKVPLTARRIFELLDETGLPRGVANLVVGAKAAVDALLRHPDVRAISFVGSTAVARHVYAEGSVHGKRVQC